MKLLNTFKTITLALVLAFGISYVFAWNGPDLTQPAPNINTAAPINTSSSAQAKKGFLSLGTTTTSSSYPLYAAGSGFFTGAVAASNVIAITNVTAPQYCIGASCITSWPSSGSSLASVGSCPDNQFLQGFDSNGNKICKFVYQIAGATEFSGRGGYSVPSGQPLATCPAGFYVHQVLGYPDLDGSLFLCLNY